MRAVASQVHRFVLRPGPGWTEMPPAPVWEHASGVRIHWSGPIIRLADGSMPSLYGARRAELNRAIRINGGNRKRGIMAYALTLQNK